MFFSFFEEAGTVEKWNSGDRCVQKLDEEDGTRCTSGRQLHTHVGLGEDGDGGRPGYDRGILAEHEGPGCRGLGVRQEDCQLSTRPTGIEFPPAMAGEALFSPPSLFGQLGQDCGKADSPRCLRHRSVQGVLGGSFHTGESGEDGNGHQRWPVVFGSGLGRNSAEVVNNGQEARGSLYVPSGDADRLSDEDSSGWQSRNKEATLLGESDVLGLLRGPTRLRRCAPEARGSWLDGALTSVDVLRDEDKQKYPALHYLPSPQFSSGPRDRLPVSGSDERCFSFPTRELVTHQGVSGSLGFQSQSDETLRLSSRHGECNSPWRTSTDGFSGDSQQCPSAVQPPHVRCNSKPILELGSCELLRRKAPVRGPHEARSGSQSSIDTGPFQRLTAPRGCPELVLFSHQPMFTQTPAYVEDERHPPSATQGCETVMRNPSGLVVSFSRQRFHAAPHPDWRSWPVHIKQVPPMFLSLWRSEAPSVIDSHLLHLFDVCWQLIVNPPLSQAVNGTSPQADLSQHEIQTLIDSGYAEPFIGSPTAFVRIFCVPESSKLRKRVICHPVEINSAIDPVTFPEISPTFLSVEENIAQYFVASGHGLSAVTADAAAFYQQFVVPAHSRRFYCFSVGDRLFCLKVIPTGARPCSSMAQAVTESLARGAAPNQPHSAYIDNLRIFSSDTLATVRDLKSRALHYNITLNEEITIGDPHQFLGILYDHGRVSLAPKSVLKASALLAELSSNRRLFFGRLEQMFGLVMWGAQVLRLNLSNFFYVFKFFARQARAGTLEKDRVTLWRAAFHQLRDWTKLLVANTPRIADASFPSFVVYTDACPSGWGAVYFLHGNKFFANGRFAAEAPIHELEERAVLAALLLLQRFDVPHTCELFIDNTVALTALLKTRSKNFHLNRVVQDIHRVVREKNIVLSPVYVPSELNLADGPSRAIPTSSRQVPQWWQL